MVYPKLVEKDNVYNFFPITLAAAKKKIDKYIELAVLTILGWAFKHA